MWPGMWTRCPAAGTRGQPLGGGDAAFRALRLDGVDLEVVRQRMLRVGVEHALEGGEHLSVPASGCRRRFQ